MKSSVSAASSQVLPGPLHCVGDVIKELYEIKEVSKYGDGKDAYLCERVSDKAALLIECLSLCHMIPPSRPDIFHEAKKELMQSRDQTESPIRGSFELHIKGDTRFYVVRSVPQRNSAMQQHSPQTSTSYVEPVLRTGPEGMQCVVYRRGLYHLEIDIPAMGFNAGVCALMMCVCFPCVMSSVIAFFFVGVFLGITAMWICSLLILIAAAAISVYWLIRNTCNHVNFVVTSEYFRQKMVLELRPRFRDSVNNPNFAETGLTVMDRFFFRQLEGWTESVQQAKIEVTNDRAGNETRRVVLEEYSGRNYALCFDFTSAQQEWLVSEINTILDNIRRQIETV